MITNRLRAFFVGAVCILVANSTFAQMDMQQRLASQAASGPPQNRTRQDAADLALHSPGLSAVPENFAQLKLGPGFLLGIKVLDDDDFNGSFRIDQSGDIVLPSIGSVHVGGDTTSEAATEIRSKLLKDEILLNPQVQVSVLEYTATQVTVVGEVVGPGTYPLLGPRPLVDILALAGGTTSLAGDEIQITRADSDSVPLMVHYSKGTDAKLVEKVIVYPGDTVQVKRAGIVYVMGAVNRPGGFVMQEDGTLNLLQAISLASGTMTTASTKAVYILRRNKDGSMIEMDMPLKKVYEGKIADLQLRPMDIIYVPTSKFKSALFNTQALVGATAAASIYRF